ncbi:MAG: hypothetical protein ACODAA_09500, partial [Gemmatimonadota bacterium]
MLHIALDEHDPAFAALEEAYEARQFRLRLSGTSRYSIRCAGIRGSTTCWSGSAWIRRCPERPSENPLVAGRFVDMVSGEGIKQE